MKEYVDIAISFLALIGMLSPVILNVNRYLKAHIRNEHIKFALEVANQAVTAVSDITGLDDNSKREMAVNKLLRRLEANGIGKNFTAEQLQQIVDKVYKETK